MIADEDPRRVRSLLSPALKKLRDQRANVLDLGRGRAGTIEVFQDLDARLYFFDMELSEGLLPSKIDALKTWLKNHTVDLCLAWDYLCCLDDAELVELTGIIERHAFSTCRVHCFLTFNTLNGMYLSEYELSTIDGILRLPVLQEQLVLFPRAMVDLQELLPTFKIEDATLRSDNRQEVVFQLK